MSDGTPSLLEIFSQFIGLQLISRCLSFGSRIIIQRIMQDIAVFGVYSVQLQLFYSLLLTPFKETMRRIMVKLKNSKDDNTKSLLLTLSVMGTIIAATLLPFMAIYFTNYTHIDEAISLADYKYGVKVMTISILLELLAEPFYTNLQNSHDVSVLGTRAKLESLAVLCRGITSLMLAINSNLKLEVYTYGSLVYSIIILILYSSRANLSLFSKLDVMSLTKHKFILIESSEILKQSILKFVLTEAENIVLVNINAMSAIDVGIYAVVSNLGSLLARFLFAPIEELSFNIFADKEGDKAAFDLLRPLSKSMCLFSLTFASFGFQYSPLLIRLLYGNDYEWHIETSEKLSFYCLYVAIIAINGVLEAFVLARAKTIQVSYFNRFLVFCSLVQVLVTIFLIKYFEWGALGLILANSITMLLRVAHHWMFLQQSNFSFRKILVHPLTIVVFSCCSFIATWMSPIQNVSLSSMLTSIFVGGIMLLVSLGTSHSIDKSILNDIRVLLKSKQKKM